jgi:hypothetical protein
MNIDSSRKCDESLTLIKINKFLLYFLVQFLTFQSSVAQNKELI